MSTVLHDSPVGRLTLTCEDEALTAIWFEGTEPDEIVVSPGATDPVLHKVRRELDEYFAGHLEHFSVPVAPSGTDFQRRVWAALQEIPYGTTTSYGAIARQIGSPAAVRAVGAANGANPIPIIVPCHRVIGADGSLTGFGGGLDRKRFLLALERGVPSFL